MKTAPISFVLTTWNRNGLRLHNLLASLLVHQELKPTEVIVVNTGDDDLAVTDFPRARILRQTMTRFNQSKAHNFGIKATDPSSVYIACTGVDFTFSREFVEVLLGYLNEQTLILAEGHRLPRAIDLTRPWAELCALSKPWGARATGTIQATSREWWFKVHGYDEAIGELGLGGMDTDVVCRARRDGLKVVRIPFHEAQALHQWHPRSPLKGLASRLARQRRKAPIVRNLEGWG